MNPWEVAAQSKGKKPWELAAAGGRMTPEQEAAERARLQAVIDDNRVFNKVYEMSNAERGVRGLAHGVAQTGRKAANLILPKALTPGFASNEAISQATADNKHLLDTTAGTIGNFTGEMAATMPIGGVVGKAGQLATRATANAPRVAQGLAKALASRGGAAATEGALAGAVVADPNSRVEGATLGGLVSGGLHGLGRVGGRLFKGLTSTSDEAADLMAKAYEQGVDLKLPLPDRVDDRGVANVLTKFLYKDLMPYVPGAKSSLKEQGEETLRRWRLATLRQSVPEEFLPQLDDLTSKGGTQDAIAKIGKFYDNAFEDTVKSYTFNTGTADLADTVGTRLANTGKVIPSDGTKVMKDVHSLIQQYGGDTLDGRELLRVKNAVYNMGRSATKNNSDLGQAYFEAAQGLDDIIRKDLSAGNVPQNLADLAKYESLADPYSKFARVRSAAKAADTYGEFTPKQLLSAAKNSGSVRQAAEGTRPLQQWADESKDIIGNNIEPMDKGFEGIIAKSIYSTLIPAYPLGRAIASPKLQNTLMGDTAVQRAVVDKLRGNAKVLAHAGRVGRTGAAITVSPEDK